jgi:hypothetical protein
MVRYFSATLPLAAVMKILPISLSRKSGLLLSLAFAVILPLFVSLAPGALIRAGQEGFFGIGIERQSPTLSVLTVLGQPLPYSPDLEPYLLQCSIIVGAFLGSYLLYPELSLLIAGFGPRWRKGYTASALALTCVAMAAFILHFGNRQFGGFDFSFLIDIGWRQVQGQLPYRDFICTMPPGFYLALKYAFQIFGVRWQAVLLATAFFSCATFLWIYVALTEILESESLAYFGALAMQCAAMLSVCYWWYNNVTEIAAAVFFLSCLLYLRHSDKIGPQASYIVSLALLGLMKPNVALPMAASGVLCTWLAASRRTRVLTMTVSAVGLNVVFLMSNRVDLGALIASYRAVAGTRGFTAAGIDMMTTPELIRFVVCVVFLMVPLPAWWPRFQAALKQAEYHDLARCLLLLSGPVVSVYAMFTNMELKDVEWPLLFCFGLVSFSTAWPNSSARAARTFFCFVLALAVSDLYLGATRYRVALVGDFFMKENVPLPPGIPFFGGMQAGLGFHNRLQQVQEILPFCPRPVFFGPRMEFGYAAFGLPSPPHLPVGWTPGTTFDADDEPAILQTWQDQCFGTLIYSKDDFTYYSSDFTDLIESMYEKDESKDRLTIFRRSGTAACNASKSGTALENRHTLLMSTQASITVEQFL